MTGGGENEQEVRFFQLGRAKRTTGRLDGGSFRIPICR